jgi:hypothetical protein
MRKILITGAAGFVGRHCGVLCAAKLVKPVCGRIPGRLSREDSFGYAH